MNFFTLTPLRKYLNEFIEFLPIDFSGLFPQSLNSELDSVYLGSDSGTELVNSYPSFVFNIYIQPNIRIPINVIENFYIIVGNSGIAGFSKVKIFRCYDLLGCNIFIQGQIALEIPSTILRSAKKNEFKKWVENISEDGQLKPSIVSLGDLGIKVTFDGIAIDNQLGHIDIGPSFIGDSNMVIDLKDFNCQKINNSLEFTFGEANIRLPDDFGIPPGTIISVQNAKISSSGFSGTCSVSLQLNYIEDGNGKKFQYLPSTPEQTGGSPPDSQEMETPSTIPHDATIFGIPGGLKYVQIVLENNQPTTFNLEGQLLIPYFDEPVDVKFSIDQNGDILTSIKSIGNGDIVLTKAELLRLNVVSLEFKNANNIGSFLISGGLEPLFFSDEGMKWPRLDVKNLKIDSEGKFSIDEAWLDLKDTASLDLFGFQMELRKIGIGTIENNRFWLDLSGGVKLIDQVPLGVDVEGFRITEPEGNNYPQIDFKGVEFQFGVPDVIDIKGLIRFFKDTEMVGFAGDMKLAIPPANITGEAGLMIGMVTKPNETFPFLYVYFGIESTAGIPLGQSGLALKGALGLFGLNVAPNRQADQNWYFDWYKKPEIGAHLTTKWGPQSSAFAVGAGLTITTTDGFVKGTKGLLILSIPGPILIINGKALVLDGLNPNPNAEPPFSATAIFDGNAGIVQFNLEAQAELVKDVLDAYAGVEAFFDFKNLSNWHVYLGQDTPKDRRIRATVLDLLEADAYLMLDMIDANTPRARLGASVNIGPKIDDLCVNIPIWGDECITFDVHFDFEGKGEVSINPEQFSGNASIDAGINIKALSLELEVGAKATLAVEGPSPFSLQTDLDINANLREPLPDYEDKFHYELTIPKVNLEINRPLASVSLFSRFTSESKGSKLFSIQSDGRESILESPMVNCDINPILAFEHDMNQGYHFLIHPAGIKTYNIGAVQMTPTVSKIIIREKKKNGGDWKSIFTTTENSQDGAKIYGTWLAESDPSSPSRPASRRLQLFSINPLTNTVHSTSMKGGLFLKSNAESKHLSQQIIDDYPTMMFCKDNKLIERCVTFDYYNPKNKNELIRNSLKWANLLLTTLENEIVIKNKMLFCKNSLEIIFPEKVIHIVIKFCKEINTLSVQKFAYPSDKELKSIFKKAKKNQKVPKTGLKKIFNNNSNSLIEYSSSNVEFEKIALSTKDKNGLCIESICYITKKDKLDFEANKILCEQNKFTLGYQFNIQPLFLPGSFYEIEVVTDISKEVIISKIEEQNPSNGDPLKERVNDDIAAKYNEIIESLPPSFTTYAYFQTEAPPQDLEPYIAYSYPSYQETNIYIDNKITIRFNRSYIKSLYSINILSVYLINKNGTPIIVGKNSLTWTDANSRILFPDEENWSSYLQDNEINALFPKDCILTIDLSNLKDIKTGDKLYLPSNKYEIIIAGMKRDDIANESAAKKYNVINIGNSYYNILFSRTFTTSRFQSPQALIDSGRIPDSNGEKLLSPKLIYGDFSVLQNELAAFADARRLWTQALIDEHTITRDYHFGIAQRLHENINLTGKEAVEFVKLELRKATDVMDSIFRDIVLEINSDIYFEESQNKLKVYGLVNPGDDFISYLWLKLPEQISFNSEPRSLGNIKIKINGNEFTPVLFNSDTTQILLQVEPYISIANSNLIISVVFDTLLDSDIILEDVSNSHHRYDKV